MKGAAMHAVRDEPTSIELRFAIHLSTADGERTVGTFVATGLVSDSGTLPLLERFPALLPGLGVPVVVRAAETLAGTAGAIALAYDGVFRPAAVGVLAGRGTWRVIGGDHAYAELGGEGVWTATAVARGGALAVDAVFEGSGSLG
jgi:hypothetical protein